MPCCVGKFLNEGCNEDYAPYEICSWAEMRQETFFLRVRHASNLQSDFSALSNITKCCYLHLLKFDTEYEKYQSSKVGCCNIFSLHRTAEFGNTRRVTDEIKAMCLELDINILVGMQLCAFCYKKLLKQFNGEFDDEDESLSLSFSDLKVASFLPKIFNFDEVQALYESTLPQGTNRFEKTLKPLQAEVIFHMLWHKDVLCVLPTNYGKTLPMIMASYIMAQKTNQRICCVIISPLRTLMTELASRLNKYNLKSISLSMKGMQNGSIQQSINDMQIGQPIFLITSPELLKLSETRDLFNSISISQICVDECHLSSEWGKNFRKDYANIHEIRQYLNCSLALFTATLSENIRQEVISNTGMKKDQMVVVSADPDRPEIFLELRKREGFEKSLQFIIDDTREKGQSATKTLVFVRGINKTHEFNFNFRRMLTDKGRIRSEDGEKPKYLSEHFSSVTEPTTRERITTDFAKEDGYIRVLFSTISYGLGINNPHIETVVIYDSDPVKSSLWQKISRGSRNGKQGKAIIFAESDKPKSNSFFKPGVCMRHTILSGLSGYKSRDDSSHSCTGYKEICSRYMCCSICRVKCSCDEVMDVVDESGDLVL